ncbi:YpzG family protein [Halobacillus campisalis]|uniref:YpzG family protein n=1 Tax=Halobacillus campisalis TaxID=435909 RepID=A0ABW2K256_9BACI
MGKGHKSLKNLHRGSKHLNQRVNGETEQTQSAQITEVQARKRS